MVCFSNKISYLQMASPCALQPSIRLVKLRQKIFKGKIFDFGFRFNRQDLVAQRRGVGGK
jgi:hypothetical protein